MKMFTLLVGLAMLCTSAFAQVPVSGGVFSGPKYGPQSVAYVGQITVPSAGPVSAVASFVVPNGSSYYLDYAQLDAMIPGAATTVATVLGNVSLQIGSQVVMTNVAVAYQAMYEPAQFFFPHPYLVQGVAGGTLVSLNVSPTGASSALWSGNLGVHY